MWYQWKIDQCVMQSAEIEIRIVQLSTFDALCCGAMSMFDCAVQQPSQSMRVSIGELVTRIEKRIRHCRYYVGLGGMVKDARSVGEAQWSARVLLLVGRFDALRAEVVALQGELVQAQPILTQPMSLPHELRSEPTGVYNCIIEEPIVVDNSIPFPMANHLFLNVNHFGLAEYDVLIIREEPMLD